MLRFLFLWGIGGARSSGGEAKVLCGVCSTLYGSTSGGKERERKEGACTAARSARGAVIEEDKWNILGVRVTSAYVCRTESSRRAGGGRRCAHRIAGAAIDARDGAPSGRRKKERLIGLLLRIEPHGWRNPRKIRTVAGCGPSPTAQDSCKPHSIWLVRPKCAVHRFAALLGPSLARYDGC